MIDLKKIPLEPYWLDLHAGVRVKVNPPDTALCGRADHAALKLLGTARQAFEDAKKAGAPWTGPDWSDEGVRAGELRYARAVAYGKAAIVGWEGVVQDFEASEIANLMRINPFAQIFLEEYLVSLVLRVAEGNASRPVPNGTPAAGPSSAETATSAAPPAQADAA